MQRIRNYGLSITLAGLFLASWLAQALVQIPQEGWHQFWISTLENWQSEFLQLFTFVVLTSFLIHKGSHESKDSQDRMESKIDVLLRRSPNTFNVEVSNEEIGKEVARQLAKALNQEFRKQGGFRP